VEPDSPCGQDGGLHPIAHKEAGEVRWPVPGQDTSPVLKETHRNKPYESKHVRAPEMGGRAGLPPSEPTDRVFFT